MALKTYQIVDGPVSVRLEPNGQWLKQYEEGYQFVADNETRTTAGGWVWIKHNEGWSALYTEDKSRYLIRQVRETPEPQNTEPETVTFYFKTNRNVRVRQTPTLAGAMVRWLDPDEIIETASTSETEADGYVWWQHKEGWSASKSLDGRWIFMETVEQPATTTPTPTTTEEPETTQTAPPPAMPTTTTPINTTTTSEKFELQAKVDVRVRSIGDLSGTFIKWIPAGTVVELDKSSETSNDGYIWYKHADGWSAAKSTDGSNVFLVEPGTVENVAVMTSDGPDVTTLPDLKTLIKRMPVDIASTDWFQYFGNNVYAYTNGKSWGYDRYAQGLHSGLDFGNNSSYIPTYAGVDATFVKEDRYGVFLKSGQYTLIYQHLTNTTKFSVGQPVSVNTKIGELDPSEYRLRHLHFEIRYKGAWIINPLYFMSDEMVNQITGKFNPTNPIYFYKSGAWNKWQTPMDQPVIKLGGPVIGPTAG